MDSCSPSIISEDNIVLPPKTTLDIVSPVVGNMSVSQVSIGHKDLPSHTSPVINASSSEKNLPSCLSAYDEIIAAKVLKFKGYSKVIIDNILKRVKKVDIYSSENISEAVMLRSISKKAYETLRVNQMTLVPLPHLATLSRRLSHFSCAPGIQTELFNLIRYRLSIEDKIGKDCAIMFDEMQLQESYDYNARLKMFFEHPKKVQVVLLRGIFRPWQQIIYYDFDRGMNLDLLNNLIMMTENCNANVRAAVCDMGNTQLLSQLEVYKKKMHYFTNPSDPLRKVYVFCDIPHCFKNLRNHILDYSAEIKLSSSQSFSIGKALFTKLIQDDSKAEFKLCLKLSEIHVNVHGHDRQRVKYATQLLSKTVSDAILYLYEDEFRKQAETIALFDDFFDVMNSRSKFDKKDSRCGLGKCV